MSSAGAAARRKGKGASAAAAAKAFQAVAATQKAAAAKAAAAAQNAAAAKAAAAAEEGAHSQLAATPAPQAPETTEEEAEGTDHPQQQQPASTDVSEDPPARMRGDAAFYDTKTDDEEGGDERLSFVPEGFIWDPSSFAGMSWNETSEGGHLPPFAPTATEHEKRAHFLQCFRCWCLTRHSTVLSSGWPLCVPADDLGQWCREEEAHFARVEEVQRLVALHDQPDIAGYFDPNSPECQLQHLAQLGLKAIAIAAFGNGRRNQEPRAILDNGLLQSHDG